MRGVSIGRLCWTEERESVQAEHQEGGEGAPRARQEGGGGGQAGHRNQLLSARTWPLVGRHYKVCYSVTPHGSGLSPTLSLGRQECEAFHLSALTEAEVRRECSMIKW